MPRKSLERWQPPLSAEPLATLGAVSNTDKVRRALQITRSRVQGWAGQPAVSSLHDVHENVILTWSMIQCPPLEAFSSAISATVSWPCPKDTLWNFPESMVNPSLLPVEWYNRAGKSESGRGEKSVGLCGPMSVCARLSYLPGHFPAQPNLHLLSFQQAAFWALHSCLLASISEAGGKSGPLVLWQWSFWHFDRWQALLLSFINSCRSRKAFPS